MNYLIKQDSALYKCYWLVQELREALEKDGINNKIKVIKRVSYGYRPFCNFRGKILLVFSLFSSNSDKKPRYSKKERQAILDKRKELKVKRKNKKKAILFSIA